MAEPKTIDKLAKICGMLGSAHDGERASAALLASQILEDLDISWRDLVMTAFAGKPEARTIDYDDRPPGWHVGYCQWLVNNRADALSKWDMSFLTSLTSRYARIRLTKKQADCFVKLAAKHGLEV